MNIAGFIDLLDRAGLDAYPVQISEAIWLARYAQPPASPGGGARRGSAQDRVQAPEPSTGEDTLAASAGTVEPGGEVPEGSIHLPSIILASQKITHATIHRQGFYITF